METPKPSSEHDWLKQFLGEWTFETECVMGPGEPPQKTSGRWRVRPVGDFWIVAEGEGEAPDGETHVSVMTLGFDQATGRFVGSFIASMMSKFWVYDGAFDGENRLVLAATGPSFTGEGEALYHDIVEPTGDGQFRFSSRVQGADGGWTDFMSADYRRQG